MSPEAPAPLTGQNRADKLVWGRPINAGQCLGIPATLVTETKKLCALSYMRRLRQLAWISELLGHSFSPVEN